MSLYECVRALGLHVKVVPVIPKGGYNMHGDEDESDDEEVADGDLSAVKPGFMEQCKLVRCSLHSVVI